jgi:hypothetical protein
MWLIYLKLMHDNFGWAKVLIWLFIIYLVGGVLYEMYGWLGIAIPILLIIAVLVYFFFIESILEKRRYKKWFKTNPRAAEKYKKASEYYRNCILTSEYPDNCLVVENVLNGKKTVDLYRLYINGQDIEKPYCERDRLYVDFMLTPQLNGIELQITKMAADIKAIRWIESRLNGHPVEVDGLNEGELESDDKFIVNRTELRTIRLAKECENKNVSIKQYVNFAQGEKGRCITLKVNVVYTDNISETVTLKLKVNHIRKSFSYQEKKPDHFSGKEILSTETVGGWTLYVTQHDVYFDEGHAFVVTKIKKGKAVLTNVLFVPENTPVLLKGQGNGHAMILEEPIEHFNYTNYLKVSEGSEKDIYLLANKSKGVGFYKWNGGELGAGKAYLPANSVKNVDYISLSVE